jgi:ubiquinone/menaquinone biosynthesis C-methylase UbiE
MSSENKAVDQSEYSDDWITSAWGSLGNENLLSKGKLNPRPRVARAIELASLEQNIKLLDIACGRAEVPAIVCQKGGFSVGLDYSESSIKFAQQVKKIHDDGSSGSIELTRADATKLPFSDESFDRITMLDIIEHLYPDQLAKMFCEVRRILKPSGYAVIHTLPNRWVYDFTYPLVQKIVRTIPVDPRGPFEKKIHINEQDLPKLYRVIRASGLNQRIWLEQHIPAQARWNSGDDRYQDNRDKVYPVLARWPGRLLELLSETPVKILIGNDIYGVLWKDQMPLSLPELPTAFTERLLCRFTSPKQ